MIEKPEWDYYDSDPEAINSLLATLPYLKNPNLKVLEPCAGTGKFIERFENLVKIKVDKYDICVREGTTDILQSDFIRSDFYNKYDLIISNFPTVGRGDAIGFDQFVRKALSDVRRGGTVCVLTKLVSLESQRRFANIYMTCKPSWVFVFSNRLKCTRYDKVVKTDTVFCWLVFEKGQDGYFAKETKLDWIHK